MNSSGILHVTVNQKGRIRLWETPAEARDKKDKDEVVVQIPLTQYQMSTVLKAEGMAKKASEELNKRIPHNGYISPSTDGY